MSAATNAATARADALEQALAGALEEAALQVSDGSRPIDEDDCLAIARRLLWFEDDWKEYLS